ncbi:DNA polymerase Y family protein [Xylophilus rhododendri]|uniref:DNA polymerase Y family protein n=1 Tax=Xylophilus rhododendri TaxID=2697032 RepID=A0A857IYE3_9BURK|nr:DNA polymerase Y family protein [Xylophilus rhododendri]QHI96570.1 DNA polymerase Y family protein [Xylophilus rhododendri]
MRWIALFWRLEAAPGQPGEPGKEPAALPEPEALGWWALQFSPRVAWLDEALLIEVSACERLFGGPRALRAELQSRNPAPEARLFTAWGDSSLCALARLRLILLDERPPADIPAALPLFTLSAAREHLEMLERLGCLCWGDVAQLPRAGLARRFGPALRDALDIAWGQRPDLHRWLELPEQFDQKLELPALAERAPELMWSAARLLRSLQFWLRGRQLGVLALELQWTLDLKRIDGIDLPSHERLLLRTAEPMQDMAHLQRLLSERLAQQKMAAPANGLRLRSLETAPWGGSSTSFLPEDNRKGDALHQLVERLSARLGEDCVLTAVPQAAHRPEAMQQWLPARAHLKTLSAPLRAMPAGADSAVQADALYPGWLLPEPQKLETRDDMPQWRGPLTILAGPHRLATGWWNSPSGEAPQRALRDYYIAESPGAGLVWLFRERPGSQEGGQWFLQGLYA